MTVLNSLTSIRRRVGRLTGDMILCTATSNGTTTTFIDSLNLHHENKIFQGRQGIFSGGTLANQGRIVRVTDLVKSTTTITFTPTLPSATQTADELELWNQRDEGVTPTFVNQTINDCIRDVVENSRLPVMSDAITFDANDPVIDIDDTVEVDGDNVGSDFRGITGVDWQDDNGDWHPLPRVDIRVDQYARDVELIGRARWLADARSIRIRGVYLPAPLSAESDTTSVDFEWITHAAAAIVVSKKMETAYARSELEGNMLRLQQRADQRLAKTVRHLKGAFWRLYDA